MLFLVKGTVDITHYMGRTESVSDMRLVRADNSDQAFDRYCAWWEAKSTNYGTHYSVRCAEVLETIE